MGSVVAVKSHAQSFIPEKYTALALLALEPSAENSYYSPRKVEYLFKNRGWLLKYNPISLFFGGSMMFYQKIVSPQLFATCGFEVSCSNHSKLAIARYGLIKGIPLTADRLMRCTPFTSLDINPIYLNETGRIRDNIDYYDMDFKRYKE